jgi:hypothetical protein
LILLNVKSRHLVEGELHCQIGATVRGEESLLELLDRYGPRLSIRRSNRTGRQRKSAGGGDQAGVTRASAIDAWLMDRQPCVRVDISVKGEKAPLRLLRAPWANAVC